MKLTLQKINKSLSPSFRALKPKRDEVDKFKKSLSKYFEVTDGSKSEESLKIHLMDFLKKHFSPDHLIEPQDNIDCVIRTGKKNTPAGILFEVKRLANPQEMISKDNINKKALHELVLYYMRERHGGNTDIKYLVICNEYEFHIFEAEQFERIFFKNTKFKKNFKDWKADKKSGKTTDFFYNDIAKPFIEKLDVELCATFFDLRKFEKPLKADDDKKLLPLLKVLSPEHLLKKSFANDSNSLNKAFYDELLFIMGLEEKKVSGKHVIKRLDKEKRNKASLIENTIVKLTREDDFNSSALISSYGSDNDERAFNIGLELCLTWVNRLLFLKLLESQIVQYHNNDKSYRFLDTKLVGDYDELADLFFGVLALKTKEREQHIQDKFEHVPYLNSSLFEKTQLEKIVGIGSLNYKFETPLIRSTVLKDDKNKPKYKSIKTLDYLFEFLDAYDFASEGSEDIQEEGKTIINASVLGLIFEKINGYKEGSIFTPGYITEYMSRKVIEKTVLEKFQAEHPTWTLDSVDDLKNHLVDHKSQKEILGFNRIINSIKICDPAVGSGHFLVSCLNELIALKSRLGVLADKNGNRLTDYSIEVDNDEIIISDSDSGSIFNYRVVDGIVPAKLQNVQSLLFNEKRVIIENCLFGVDINPNSVMICRLRLWIELLKLAYYQSGKSKNGLETLPNIDINIKQGNSLLSRYTLDQNLSSAFKSAGLKVKDYKAMVQQYKDTKDRATKLKLRQNIERVKSRFRREQISNIDTEITNEIEDLKMLESQEDLFALTNAAEKKRDENIKAFRAKIKSLEAKKKAHLESETYLSALEWRFEFPEVLDKKGKFVGFDIIIANPPYMRIQEIEATQPEQKNHYERTYKTAKGSYDLANLFFELASQLVAKDGNNIFIFPHKLFNSASGGALRELLLDKKMMKHIAHFGANMVFDNATTYTCVALFNNTQSDGFHFKRFKYRSSFKKLSIDAKRKLLNSNDYQFLDYIDLRKSSALYGTNQWIFFDNKKGFSTFRKIHKNSDRVSDVFKIFVGVQTSRDTLYVVKKLNESKTTFEIEVNPTNKQDKPIIRNKKFTVEKQFFKPFLMGKDVHRYQKLKTDKLVFFPYDIINSAAKVISYPKLKQLYPLTYKFVQYYKKEFLAREAGKAGNHKEWYRYLRENNLGRFNQKKLSSMEICSVHPNLTINENIYHSTTVYSWIKDNSTPYLFYSAIVNSTLFWWYLKHTGDTLSGDARRMKTNYLNPFPFPKTTSKQEEQNLVILAEKAMLTTETQKLAPILKKIDKQVYALYGLKKKHIKAIEESL